MRFSSIASISLGMVATGLADHLEERAIKSTSVTKIVTTKISTVPLIVNTAIGVPGVYTLVPNVLTVTVSATPAYYYAETFVVTSTVETSKITKIITISKAKATSTSKTSVTTAKTSTASIPYKTDVYDCNNQGTPSDWMQHYYYGSTFVNNVLNCQSVCLGYGGCTSYGFDTNTGLCSLYAVAVDVVASNSGIFFSDANPSDYSDYCYGTGEPTRITTTLTSTSSATPTKTGVSNCNVQGTANSMVVGGTSSGSTIYNCQSGCRLTTYCQTYSYDYSTTTCTFYQSAFNVIPGTTGVWFSAKYPADGSDYCYGTTTYYKKKRWLEMEDRSPNNRIIWL